MTEEKNYEAIAFALKGWFSEPGAYVLVDGQYGSTGKGLLAGLIAEVCVDEITHVTTNAGPNSGHTAFFDGEKIVTQQVPVASVFLEKLGRTDVVTLLNAGAIVEPDILQREVDTWLDYRRVLVHPTAAIIRPEDQAADKANVATIASTGKGIGPALINKLRRRPDAVCRQDYMPILPSGMGELGWDRFWDWNKDYVFVETAQGFSLGLNSGRFYPNVTTRECTVMQAISDARIPAQMVKKVVATFRTYPIRVGNTELGYSGDIYPDQEETTWEALGLEPELTTVTKRVRRVFTWSRLQFKECIAANRPDVLFINFLNYMNPLSAEYSTFASNILYDYAEVMGGRLPDAVLGGHGPLSSDIRVMYG